MGSVADEERAAAATAETSSARTSPEGPAARGGMTPSVPNDAPELPSRFEVKRTIGRGGMGVVLEVHDRSLGRDVAVKVLPRETHGDQSVRARFAREARAAGALDHPGIVVVHDVDVDAGFIVMELIHGESLGDRLAREKRLDVAEVRRIGAALLDALSAAHGADIVHRDIKPANILIAEDGSIKLVDFGVASFGDSDLTSTGTRIGTPAYMAPEQLRGRVVDPRADLYSVGATLFEAATGTKLHRAEGTVDDPKSVVLEATRDEALAVALDRAVRERADERFATARAFASALAASRVEPPQSTVRSSRRTKAAVALGVLLGGAALAFWASGRHDVTVQAATVAPAPSSSVGAPAARVHTIAVLPFDDKTGDPQLDFAGSGFPYLLDGELTRLPDITVLAHYRLRERLSDPAASIGAWVDSARAAGADFVVRGELSSRGGGVHVLVIVEQLSPARTVARFERDSPTDELARAIASLAGEIASAATGRTISIAPGTARALEVERELQKGIAAVEEHDFVHAQQHLRAALALDTTLAEGRYYLALVGWWTERPTQETLAEIDLALAGDLDDARRGFLAGLQLFVNSDFAGAIRHFRALAERYPNDRDIQYGLTEALFHGGYAAEAMRTYRRVCQLSPRFRLGIIHPLMYYLSHGDDEGIEWATTQAGGAWRSRALFARRDYSGAIDLLQRLAEKGDGGITPGAAEVHADLVATYAVAGKPQLALSVARRDFDRKAPYEAVPLLGLQLALGNAAEARAMREHASAYARSLRGNRAEITVWTTVALLYVPGGDATVLRPLLAAFEASVVPENAKAINTHVARVFLSAALGERAQVEAARHETFPEVVAIAEALAAERAGNNVQAAASWRRALELDGDGRFFILESFFLAKVLRTMKDGDGTVRACSEVVEPRLFNWLWGSTVGPCLLWTAEAQAALGRSAEARATYRRLIALRASASKDDELVVAAQLALATLR